MNKEESKIWKQGYDMGQANVLKDKQVEIEIGEAILRALDKRYKTQSEED